MPYLAESTGRLVTLCEFYSYLVEWPVGRRINDMLKQRTHVDRARTYAAQKPISPLSLPNIGRKNRTAEQPPSFVTRPLSAYVSPTLTISNSGKEKQTACSNRALESSDEEAYRTARALAFAPGDKHQFRRIWSGAGRWLAEKLGPNQESQAVDKKPIPFLNTLQKVR